MATSKKLGQKPSPHGADRRKAAILAIVAYLQVFGYVQLAKPFCASGPHTLPTDSDLAAAYPCNGTHLDKVIFLATRPALVYRDYLRLQPQDSWVSASAACMLLRVVLGAVLPASLRVKSLFLAHRLLGPLTLLGWLLATEQEPSSLSVWFTRSWPLLDCAYMLVSPTSFLHESVYGVLSFLINAAIGWRIRSLHPHLGYPLLPQLVICVTATLLITYVHLLRERAERRRRHINSSSSSAAGSGGAGNSGKDLDGGNDAGAGCSSRGTCGDESGDVRVLAGAHASAADALPSGVTDATALQGGRDADAASPAAAAAAAEVAARAEAPAAATTLHRRRHRPSASNQTGASTLGEAAATARHAAASAEYQEVLRLTAPPPPTLPDVTDAAAPPAEDATITASRPHLPPHRFPSLQSVAATAAAVAARLSYTPVVQLIRVHVKIHDADPDQVAAGYQERVGQVVAAAGYEMEAVYLRRGCIELVVNARDWRAEGAPPEDAVAEPATAATAADMEGPSVPLPAASNLETQDRHAGRVIIIDAASASAEAAAAAATAAGPEGTVPGGGDATPRRAMCVAGVTPPAGVAEPYPDIDIGALIRALQLPDGCSARSDDGTGSDAEEGGGGAKAVAEVDVRSGGEEARTLAAAAVAAAPPPSSIFSMHEGGDRGHVLEPSRPSWSAPSRPPPPLSPRPSNVQWNVPSRSHARSAAGGAATAPRIVRVHPRVLLAGAELAPQLPSGDGGAVSEDAGEDDIVAAWDILGHSEHFVGGSTNSSAAGIRGSRAGGAASVTAPQADPYRVLAFGSPALGGARPDGMMSGPFRFQIEVRWPDPWAVRPAAASVHASARMDGLDPANSQASASAGAHLGNGGGGAAMGHWSHPILSPTDDIELLLRSRGMHLPSRLVEVRSLGLVGPVVPATHAQVFRPLTEAPPSAPVAPITYTPSSSAAAAVVPMEASVPAMVVPYLTLQYTVEVPYIPARPGLLLLDPSVLAAVPVVVLQDAAVAAELQAAVDSWNGGADELDDLLLDIATFVQEVADRTALSEALAVAARAAAGVGPAVRQAMAGDASWVGAGAGGAVRVTLDPRLLSLGRHLHAFAVRNGWIALSAMFQCYIGQETTDNPMEVAMRGQPHPTGLSGIAAIPATIAGGTAAHFAATAPAPAAPAVSTGTTVTCLSSESDALAPAFTLPSYAPCTESSSADGTTAAQGRASGRGGVSGCGSELLATLSSGREAVFGAPNVLTRGTGVGADASAVPGAAEKQQRREQYPSCRGRVATRRAAQALAMQGLDAMLAIAVVWCLRREWAAAGAVCRPSMAATTAVTLLGIASGLASVAAWVMPRLWGFRWRLIRCRSLRQAVFCLPPCLLADWWPYVCRCWRTPPSPAQVPAPPAVDTAAGLERSARWQTLSLGLLGPNPLSPVTSLLLAAAKVPLLMRGWVTLAAGAAEASVPASSCTSVLTWKHPPIFESKTSLLLHACLSAACVSLGASLVWLLASPVVRKKAASAKRQ